MKLLKRGIAIVLSICLVLTSQTIAFADEIQPVTVANGNISVSVSPENGGFVIRTLDGDVLNKDDDNKDLLYRSGDFDTSFTSIRITETGGSTEEYIFGNNYSFLGLGGNDLAVTKDTTGISAVWTVKNIKVTQRLEPVIDVSSNYHGMVKISYAVENNRSKEVTVEARLLLDTALGSQDYAYYSIPQSNGPATVIYSEKTLQDAEVPVYFEANEAEDLSGTTGYMVLEAAPNVDKPYKIALGHWNNLASSIFDFTPNTDLAFVSVVNAGYKTADSAMAAYYNLGGVNPQSESSFTTFYGVRSRVDFNIAESGVDITLNAPASLTLNESKTKYLDRSGADTGKFVVSTNLLNVKGNYNHLIMAAYTEAGILPLDDDGNEHSTPPTRENPQKIDIYNFETGAYNARNFDWNFKAQVDSRTSLRRIEFRIYNMENAGGLLLEENVVGSSSMYILCPGGNGDVEKITFNSLSPDIVYMDGTRRLYITGSGFNFLEPKTSYTLRAYNVADSSLYYNIPLENITFRDTGSMDVVLDEKMRAGTYNLVFHCETALVNAGIAARLTAPVLSFNVSDDPKYRNDTYGVLAVFANDAKLEMDREYYVTTYTGEDSYDKHGVSNLLLEFKGYFAKEEKDSKTTVYTSVLTGAQNTVVINQALDFKDGTITITEVTGKGGGVKVEMDGKLLTNASGTKVSEGKISISELKNGYNYELVSYDDFGERQPMGYSAEMITLSWASDYLGYSMFDGFPVAIRDAVFGKIHKREDDGSGIGDFDGYTVSFGGSMNLRFLVPGDSPLGLEAKDVVFGRNEGFLGVNAEGSIIIPQFAKPIGSLAGTFSANTINNNYTVGVHGTLEFSKLFEAEFELIVKEGEDSKGPIPDRMGFYLRDFKPGQPLGPPILFLTGGGGGYDQLYDTIYSKGGVPPLTLDMMAQVSLLRIARSEGAFKISLGGFAAGLGPMVLEIVPIQWGFSGEIAAGWAPDLYIYGRQEIDIIAGVIRGGMQIGIGEINDRFLAEMFINAFIKIPSEFLIGTDITVAEAALGLSTERIWGVVEFLGMGIGAAYYWGEEKVDFSVTDLDRFKPEFKSLFDDASAAVYQHPGTGQMLMMRMGTNILKAPATQYYGGSSLKSDDDKKKHTMMLGNDGKGGVFTTFTFNEEITEKWAKDNISIVYDDGSNTNYFENAVFPQKDQNGQVNASNANALLSTANGKSMLTVSIPPEAVKTGKWEINTVKAAEASMYLVDPLPQIKTTTAVVNGNNITVNWTGDKLNETTINFYISETQDGTGVLLGEATTPASGTQSFTLPGNLPTGSYFIYGIAQNEESFSRAITDTEINYTNSNTPSQPASVTLTNVGNEYFRADIGGSSDADGYYIDVYEQTAGNALVATDYMNLMFEKGDDILLGGNQKNSSGQSFGMFGGKTYVAAVRAYKDLGNEGAITGPETRSQPTRLNEYTPTVITYTGEELFNTTNVGFTLKADKAVTGTISVDEAASGGAVIAVTNEVEKQVSITLADGSHKIRYSGKDGNGNSFLFEKLITVDTTPPTLLLSSPVNGGLFDADGTVDISGIAEPGAVYSITVDGQPLASQRNLDDKIGEEGILLVEDLYIGNEKDTKNVAITVKDAAGNSTSRSAVLKNGALAGLTRVKIDADGAVISEKNITLKDSGDTTVNLKLYGETNSGDFEITDSRLVSWNVSNKAGTAAVDGNNTLTISANSLGYVEGMLNVGEKGVISDSLSFGNDINMQGLYTITFMDGSTNVGTAKTDFNGKLTDAQLPTLPSKSGYVFKGWYLEPTFNTMVTSSTVFNGSHTCYANWAPGSGRSKKVYRAITATSGEGGDISPSGTVSVQKGNSVTFTMLPDAGYEVSDVKVNGQSVGAVDSYKFASVTEDSTIHATFKLQEAKETWDNPFRDVKPGKWYYDSVRYVYEKGLFAGISQDMFGPNQPMTRGMLVTVLYRASGADGSDTASFDDVKQDAYYAKAVAWAVKNGIVKGYDEKTFKPNEEISREQIAAVLERYAEFLGRSTEQSGNMSQFNDASEISKWAKGNMEWAVGTGLITGKGDGIVDPKGKATRAEVATILQRFFESR